MPWLLLGIVAAVALTFEKVKGNVTEKDQKSAQALTRAEWQKKFLAAAKNVDWHGIPVAIALAQADLETGGGSGNVFRQTNNLFSLRVGSGWQGSWNGKDYKGFRSYDTYEASMRDWVTLMHFPLYREALAYALAGNVRGFAYTVKKVGYDSSSPTYAEDLIGRFNNQGAIA